MTKHRLDALVAPTSGARRPDRPRQRRLRSTAAVHAGRVAGYPHITVPAGFVFGLPVGRVVLRPGLERADADQDRLRLRAGDEAPEAAAVSGDGGALISRRRAAGGGGCGGARLRASRPPAAAPRLTRRVGPDFSRASAFARCTPRRAPRRFGLPGHSPLATISRCWIPGPVISGALDERTPFVPDARIISSPPFTPGHAGRRARRSRRTRGTTRSGQLSLEAHPLHWPTRRPGRSAAWRTRRQKECRSHVSKMLDDADRPLRDDVQCPARFQPGAADRRDDGSHHHTRRLIAAGCHRHRRVARPAGHARVGHRRERTISNPRSAAGRLHGHHRDERDGDPNRAHGGRPGTHDDARCGDGDCLPAGERGGEGQFVADCDEHGHANFRKSEIPWLYTRTPLPRTCP